MTSSIFFILLCLIISISVNIAPSSPVNNISISSDTFERIKKVWIANEVKIIDSVDRAYDNLYDDIINYGKVVTNRLDLIRRMSINTLNKLIDNIDFSNISVVKMMSNDNNN